MKKLDCDERALVIRAAPKLLAERLARTPLNPYNCVFNCRVLRDVYRNFNIPVRPLPCVLNIGNEEYCRRFWEKTPEGPPQSVEEVGAWADAGAYAVLCGHVPGGAKPGRYDGHLVLIADNYYVDASIQQASRPEKGIVLREALIRPLPPDDSLRQGASSVVIGPTGLPILVMPKPEARDCFGNTFEGCPGWENPYIPAMVEKITASLREMILKARKRSPGRRR